MVGNRFSQLPLPCLLDELNTDPSRLDSSPFSSHPSLSKIMR
jgi:hypothetical protein